jgi:ethanolamine utilization protein EutS
MIQKFIPGKQVTLCHLISHPDPELYRKLGAIDINSGALGILTITPSKGAIIGTAIDTPGEYLEGRWYWNRLINSIWR